MMALQHYCHRPCFEYRTEESRHVHRKRSEDDVMYLGLDGDPEASLGPAAIPASTGPPAGDRSAEPAAPSGPGGTTGAPSAPPAPHTDAATSTSTLTVPPPVTLGLDGDQHRSVRDVFVSEALDPRLKSELTEQFRTLLGSSDDSVINRSVGGFMVAAIEFMIGILRVCFLDSLGFSGPIRICPVHLAAAFRLSAVICCRSAVIGYTIGCVISHKIK